MDVGGFFKHIFVFFWLDIRKIKKSDSWSLEAGFFSIESLRFQNPKK